MHMTQKTHRRLQRHWHLRLGSENLIKMEQGVAVVIVIVVVSIAFICLLVLDRYLIARRNRTKKTSQLLSYDSKMKQRTIHTKLSRNSREQLFTTVFRKQNN